MSRVGKLLVMAGLLLAIAVGVYALYFGSENNSNEIVQEDPAKAEMLRSLMGSPGQPPQPGPPPEAPAGPPANNP
ncbi:MAG: hypothetical protein IT365_23105 [Candidatus Hydrogenedentes bacterium]|nr:hypothetical protein [Candidatus Hydrogenedentota bacterium]